MNVNVPVALPMKTTSAFAKLSASERVTQSHAMAVADVTASISVANTTLRNIGIVLIL
jgi:hypothetical protein